MESLPAEILQRIAEYLDDRNKSNLKAFSRCSKASHGAAVPTLYRDICIRVQVPKPESLMQNQQPTFVEPSKLEADIDYWSELLERNKAWAVVRSLRLKEYWVSESQSDRFKMLFGSPPPAGHLDLADRDDIFLGKPQISLLMPWHLKYAYYPSEATDILPWQSLAAWIGRLSALRSLYYDISHLFPNWFSQAIQRPGYRPKIHLMRFWFRDYLRYDNRDPVELDVLRCSEVQSISARSCGCTINGDEDYTHEAILSRVNEPDNGIEHLSLLTDLGRLMPNMTDSLVQQLPRRPWPGFDHANGVSSEQHSRLTSFELGGSGPVRMDLVEASFRGCNMRRLTTLKLRIPSNHRSLGWLATNVSLPSLNTLVLGVQDDEPHFRGPECGDCDLVSEFLASLPPLKAICFIGDIDQNSLGVTMQRHGHSLKRLWFPHPQRRSKVFFNPTRVDSIQLSCPILEELSLSIPRSAGSRQEVEMYKALGGLPQLRHLAISLDCEDSSLHPCDEDDCDPTPIYPDFDDVDKECIDTEPLEVPGLGRHGVHKGHIRLAIQNAALDEKLARNIFAKISESKPRDSDGPSLERLELRPVRGTYTKEAREVVEKVGRWWLLQRAATCRDDIVVTKIRCPADVDEEQHGPPTWELDPEIEPIFRKIWPSNLDDDVAWTLRWRSLPLAE